MNFSYSIQSHLYWNPWTINKPWWRLTVLPIRSTLLRMALHYKAANWSTDLLTFLKRSKLAETLRELIISTGSLHRKATANTASWFDARTEDKAWNHLESSTYPLLLHVAFLPGLRGFLCSICQHLRIGVVRELSGPASSLIKSHLLPLQKTSLLLVFPCQKGSRASFWYSWSFCGLANLATASLWCFSYLFLPDVFSHLFLLTLPSHHKFRGNGLNVALWFCLHSDDVLGKASFLHLPKSSAGQCSKCPWRFAETQLPAASMCFVP